jgi:hypothetical protein
MCSYASNSESRVQPEGFSDIKSTVRRLTTQDPSLLGHGYSRSSLRPATTIRSLFGPHHSSARVENKKGFSSLKSVIGLITQWFKRFRPFIARMGRSLPVAQSPSPILDLTALTNGHRRRGFRIGPARKSYKI